MATIGELVGDTPRIRILEVFITEDYRELSTTEIAERADIHRTTVYNHLAPLLERGIIEQSGKEGNSPLYRINKESPVARALGRLHYELLTTEHRQSDGDSESNSGREA